MDLQDDLNFKFQQKQDRISLVYQYQTKLPWAIKSHFNLTAQQTQS